MVRVAQKTAPAGNTISLKKDDAKKGSAVDKLEEAKKDLKAKYGLKDIREEGKAVWTESQLKKLASVFSRMGADEQKLLQGVTLVLREKIETKKIKGRTFAITGQTIGTHRVELTPAGVPGTMLHEAGHLIQNAAIANAKKLFEHSKFKADLETARAAVNASSKLNFKTGIAEDHALQQINAAMLAARAFERSGDDDRAANREALEAEEMGIPIVGPGDDLQTLRMHRANARAFFAALFLWSDEQEKAVGPLRRLDEFVGIVKKHKLARRSVAFTPYAEANWPEKPEEFFSEAYAAWRTNPAAMRNQAKPLHDWFAKGGHLGPMPPKAPSPRQQYKIPIPKEIPALHKQAPGIEKLLLAVGETFIPTIEGAVNLIP